MPIHNWKKVYAGIFHDFHQSWSLRIKESLNAILPPDYYALIEQSTTTLGDVRLGPDVLALHANDDDDDTDEESLSQSGHTSGGMSVLAPAPKATSFATSDAEFYRKKKNIVTVRHVSRDRIVAAIEIVSWGNKSSKRAFEKFLAKSCDLLDRGIHLLIVDLYPPSNRDPEGIHSAIWEEIEGEIAPLPAGKDRIVASYQCGIDLIQAYVEPLAIGDTLPPMPIFLKPGGCVMVPLEATYASAYETVPARWRKVIEG